METLVRPEAVGRDNGSVDVSGDTLTIESKGHQDLVSDGDREVESFIRAAIGAAYPDDGVVGEEHGNVAGASGYVWVIDPIDGSFFIADALHKRSAITVAA